MRVKKYLALTFAAILATTMLTACPWDQEEDKTDDASSVPVTSTDTSQDDDSNDSGDDDGQPTKPSFKVSATNGNITDQSFVLDEGTGTYKATFTTNPTKDNYVVSSVEATVTTAGETLSASWPNDTATRARTLSVRTDAKLSLTTSDNGKTFTLTGIPADATSCSISVTFTDLGYVIEGGTYKVHNADGLLAWAQSKDVLTTDCTLTDDIDLGEENWTPIGNTSYPYTGTFDGGGHAISGLQVSGGDYVGLFGYVNGGTVQNVNLTNVRVSGSDWVGSVAGYNYNGTIQGCMVSGNVSGYDWVGGVVGYNYDGTVEGCCFADGNVMASDDSVWVGGVVGANSGIVEGCCFAGDRVTSTNVNAYVGGVAGYSSRTITGCYWSGTIYKGGQEQTTTDANYVNNWESITNETFLKYFTIGPDGKPVPKAIAENSTPAESGLTQKVLDAARVIGL